MEQKWVVCSFILLVLSMPMVVNTTVPAVFVLGDSTADVGTNSHFNFSAAKADMLPNGIDYPGSKPTGRFSNGYNSADFLSRLMGFRRSPPPYLDLLDKKLHLSKHIVYGANFASGAAGLIDNTGTLLGECTSLRKQIGQFETLRGNLTKQLGPELTDKILSKSMFFISVGSNDIFQYYIFNRTFEQQEFITSIVGLYANYLKVLYSLGARKFGIISVPAIGCCPSQRVHNHTTGGCIEDLNTYSRIFYSTMKAMLTQLSLELKEMRYSLGNAYEMMINFMNNPDIYRFKELASACCGKGIFNGTVPCTEIAYLCMNREEYLFWDWFHPTQAASKLAAQTLYDGDAKFVTPINFKQLAEVDD